MEENIREEYLADNSNTEADDVPFKRLIPASMVIAKILSTKRMDVIEQYGLNESHIWDPQYKDLYRYIKEHYAKYQHVPDYTTLLREDRFQMIIDTVTMEVSEPDEFLKDQLWEDYIFHKTANVLQQAARLTEVNSKEGVLYLNQQMSLLNQEVKPGGMDIIAQAAERLAEYDHKRSADNWYIPTGFPQLDDKVMGWSPGEELIVLVARTGVGKEQPLYSRILTPTGWTTMRNIKAGDTVITGTGEYAKVVETFPQGVKPVYRVYFSDGTYADAGLDHLWTVESLCDRLDGSKPLEQRQVKTTRELMNSLEERWSIDCVAPVTFTAPKYHQLLDPYLLGVILGSKLDIFNDYITIRLTNTKAISQVRRHIKRYGCVLTQLSACLWSITKTRKASWNSVVDELRSLKLVHCNDANKFIPEVYLRGSIEDRRALLAGLLESLHTASPQANSCSTVVSMPSNDIFESNFVELVGSLGISYTVSRVAGEHLPHTVQLRMPTSKSDGQVTRRYIEQIKFVRDYECKCIMVDHPSHTYITDNYIVTHNTWVMTKMLTESWRNGFNVGLIEPEMTGIKIGYRFDAIYKSFSNRRLNYAQSLEDDDARYRAYIEELQSSRTKFCVAHPKDFGGTVTVSSIKQWCITNSIKVLGIDGISYIKDERGRSSDSMTSALTNISADLMELSIELGIPVIIVVQSNRGSIETGGRPTLETIRDSDGIAYSASQVYAIYVKNDALHINLMKNRNGESNFTLAYDWDIDTGRFEFLQEGEVDADDDEDESTHSYSNGSSSNNSNNAPRRPDRSTGYAPAGMNAEQVQDYERHELSGPDVF